MSSTLRLTINSNHRSTLTVHQQSASRNNLIAKENKTHQHEVSTCATTSKRWRTENSHKISTENNPSDLMTKYLETAKTKKHNETIGLHPHLRNKSSINMISNKPIRRRGSYSTTPRATTPQPRQRRQTMVANNNIIKEEGENSEDNVFDMVRLQYFGEEAARMDVNFNDENEHDINKLDLKSLHQTTAVRQTGSTTSSSLLLSLGRLCDDWRRRPVQGTLQFIQRHERELKDVSTRTKTLLFMTCMLLLITALRIHFATNIREARTMDADMEDAEETILLTLTERTLNYIVQIDKDMPEEIIRINLMQDVDDDLQPQIDRDAEAEVRREEAEGNFQELCERRAQMTFHNFMDEQGRVWTTSRSTSKT
eukprot:2163513-Amphidinium_carterae.2